MTLDSCESRYFVKGDTDSCADCPRLGSWKQRVRIVDNDWISIYSRMNDRQGARAARTPSDVDVTSVDDVERTARWL